MKVSSTCTRRMPEFCIIKQMISVPQGQEEESNSAHIRHIVCLKFKPETNSREYTGGRKKIPCTYNSLSPGIISIEWGLNNSPEGLNKGFTPTASQLPFANETRTQQPIYPTPAHQAFVEILKPLLDDVFVIDYNL